MRALILAAGRGQRMGSYTETHPKCLMTLAGETLLTRQVCALRAAGADEIGIVTGWRGEAFANMPLARFENPDWAATTMVASLSVASRWLTDDLTLVSYGDIVYSPAAATALADAPSDDVSIAYDPDWLALWRRRFADPMTDAESFRVSPDGAVREIGREGILAEEVHGQYMGLLRLTPEGYGALMQVLGTAPEGTHLDMTALLSLALEAGVRIRGVPVPGPWCELDHPGDVALATRIAALIDAGASGRLDDLLDTA